MLVGGSHIVGWEVYWGRTERVEDTVENPCAKIQIQAVVLSKGNT